MIVLDRSVNEIVDAFKRGESPPDILQMVTNVLVTKQCGSVLDCQRYIAFILYHTLFVSTLMDADKEKPYAVDVLYASPQFTLNMPHPDGDAHDASETADIVRGIRDLDVVVFMMPMDMQNVDPVFVVGTVTDLGDVVSISCSAIGYFISSLSAQIAMETFSRTLSNARTGISFDVHLVNLDTSQPFHDIRMPLFNPPFASTENYDLGVEVVDGNTLAAIMILLSATVQGPTRPVSSPLAVIIARKMTDNTPLEDVPESRSWVADIVEVRRRDVVKAVDRAPPLRELEVV